VVSDLLSAISIIAELLKPFLPETSEKIFQQTKTKESQPIFPRI
jgi:methionyl-tRNA synthetase